MLGLAWTLGCHDKHLSSQFWDWSGHQSTMTNISAVSSGTGLVIRVQQQTSRQSVLGLIWSPWSHDKHLSAHFWDWSSGCHDDHLCSQPLDQPGQHGATTIISAVWNPRVPQATCDSCFAYQSIFQSVTDKQVAISLFETR